VAVRNDPAQYDDLVTQWWLPRGQFAMLHWLAAARAALVPPATRPDALLVDLGCGGGLMAPHVAKLGYRHVGVDLTDSALSQAARHGVTAVRGDVRHVPLADGCADVVTAGEILEHVPDLPAAVGEACRLLRPGGLLVVDTLADTVLSRLIAVTLAERVPGGPPPGIHDPALFVNRKELVAQCARHGVALALRGIRPSMIGTARWLAGRADAVRMVPVATTSVLFQGIGRKENA
jgi:2-polyprenyl-6-hydroxyphenyl methylase/3-demethylubiquinone-9 3-methyltransferase